MGQLGHGDLKSSNFPRKIEFFEQHGLVVDYISCGGCHSAAVTKDGAFVVLIWCYPCCYSTCASTNEIDVANECVAGTVYTWGEAHWGQLGLPKEFSDLHQSLPAKCPVLQDGSEEKIVKISCGLCPCR